MMQKKMPKLVKLDRSQLVATSTDVQTVLCNQPCGKKTNTVSTFICIKNALA